MSEILVGADLHTQPSFSLSNRLRRALWNCVYVTVFRLSPRPCHAWRAGLLKLFGAKLGNNCHVYPKSIIWAPWNLIMHDSAVIGDGVICYNMAFVTLGQNVVVSQGSHLCTGTHDYASPNFQLYAKPIVVGADAWICADCFVAPGVTIGDGAVIGARSVVTKNMPDWTVCAGHSCRPLKPRVMREGHKDVLT